MAVTRAITLPLLILNFSLYLVVLALAGWVMNMAIDTDFTTVTESSTTIYFMIFALIAGAVGMGSVLSGFHHMHAWTLESFSASAATAIVALMLTLEALGLASKEINSGAFRHPTLKALEALVIIVGGTQLFYVITLQLGKISGEFS